MPGVIPSPQYAGGVEPQWLPRTSSRLPRSGYALIKLTVVDEGGFTYDYDEMEAPLGVVRDSIGAIQLQALPPEAESKKRRSRSQ